MIVVQCLDERIEARCCIKLTSYEGVEALYGACNRTKTSTYNYYLGSRWVEVRSWYEITQARDSGISLARIISPYGGSRA